MASQLAGSCSASDLTHPPDQTRNRRHRVRDRGPRVRDRGPRVVSDRGGEARVFRLVLGVRAVIAVRSGTVGTGIGNGDRTSGITYQQRRYEHAKNTCSETGEQFVNTIHIEPLNSSSRLLNTPTECGATMYPQ